MGKLQRLELFNFKSYKGHTSLLFGDAFFTSIIGPNGSGKSNAMDAISFVLGIKSSHLRSAHLKELIYRGRVLRTSVVNGAGETNEVNGHDEEVNGTPNGTQERNDPKSAWVMAVYEDDAGDEQTWKRTITSQGVSEYRMNDRVVTAQAYNDALESENILIKARNFLVFQGDVEAIAIQKPTDLTRLIEQVSGSLEYKAEYDRLKAETEEAAETQSVQLNKRRVINSEIRQYQEQKKEADKYNRKAEERDQAIVTHVLWKVYHLQRQIEESTVEIQKHQHELKEFRRGVEKYERDLDSAKKDYAERGRHVSKAEKAIKAKEREIDDMTNSLVPVDEQIQVSTKQLTKYTNRINDITKEKNSQDMNVKQLEKDLKVVEKAQAQWQAEWDRTANKQGGQLNTAALADYARLKEEVNKRSSADQIRIDSLKRQRTANEGTVNSLKGKVEGAEFQLHALESDLTNINDRKAEMSVIVDETKKAIETQKKELNALISKRLQVEQTRTELEEKLQEVLRKLIDADDGRKQSEKERRIKETIATLKRTYPGVRGRVNELCRPKQKKFTEAVSTVLGRHFDAIVVDNEATARQCIEYLRDQRAGQATFIPLDTIQVKAVASNLKGMHRKMQPAIDVVEYDQAVARAISYACGNAIVCDDLDTAKYLCYEKNVDAKAVTLDGTVIHKGGLMTGGRGKEQNARQFGDMEVDKFNKLKDKLMADIGALPPSRSRGTEEDNLQVELSSLESRYTVAKEEVDGLTRNLASKKKEVDHAKGQLKEAQPKYRIESKKLDDLDDDIRDYQDAVSGVEDEVYGAFCVQHGFDDIREYEARQGSLQQDAAQKKLEFTTQKSRLQNQLSFEKTRLQATQDRIQTIRDKDARDRANIDELNEQKTGIQDDIDHLRAELEGLEEKLVEEQEAYEKAAEKLTSKKQEILKRAKGVEATLKNINSLEAEMQRHSTDRYGLYRRCKIENIPLPLDSGSATFDELPINDMTNGDAMEVDGDETMVSALQVPTTSDYGISPDFSELEDDLREDPSEAVDGELADKIHDFSAALEKMAPNMHAAERLGHVEDKFRNTEQEFKEATKQYKESKNAFEEVQKKREELFNKAFDHISEQIEPIYANLTRSTSSVIGGKAYLTADTEEPYLSGISYHTMPPAKRFRDMEHLSGGEKTMAALALLFAIHSYQPSPFFVLDEVDAALDNENVGKLVNYVRNHAGPGMQFIVISLKTGFFQGSEALVGVYRDQMANSSKVLTLDVSILPVSDEMSMLTLAIASQVSVNAKMRAGVFKERKQEDEGAIFWS